MQHLKNQEDFASTSFSFKFDSNDYSHIAWIPCVSGHLDYCLMSIGLCGNFIKKKFDKDPVNVNYCNGSYPEGHQRRVILKSWVDWRDLLKGDGKFNVVVLAETNGTSDLDARHIQGRVCIFPHKYEKQIKREFDNFYLPISKAKQIWLEHKKRDITNPAHLSNYAKTVSDLNRQFDALNESLKRPAFGETATETYYIDFYLKPDGFIYLKYVNNPIDETNPLSDDDKYVLIRQAFFYLKYSLHKHKHHGEEADALTSIIPYTQSDLEKNAGLQIIGQLKRELTRIKRALSEKKYYHDDTQALGILGYMQSLLQSALQSKLIDSSIYAREIAWLEGMTQSIRTQSDSVIAKKYKFNLASQNAIQIIIFLLAFISFSVVGLLTVESTAGVKNSLDDWPKIAPSFTKWLLEPYHYIMFCVALFLSLGFMGLILRFFAFINFRPRVARAIKLTEWKWFLPLAILVPIGLAYLFFKMPGYLIVIGLN